MRAEFLRARNFDYVKAARAMGVRNWTIITKHTGTMDLVVHTLGRATHISKKEQGVDAISKMMRAIAAINAMKLTHTHDPELPGLPRLNVGSVIGGRGRSYTLRGAYTVSDFCSCYVNIRFNPSQSGDTIIVDGYRAKDGTNKMNAREITFADGKKLFAGSEGTGAPR